MSSYRLKAFFEALARFRQINQNQAAIYKALLSFRGTQGCFPSHATLAAESGVSERTVRNALREARLRGWIDWTNTRYGRRQSSNRYRFLIPSDTINAVLNGIKKFKRKTAEISEFFRRQQLPGSPYYYIRKAASQLFSKTESPTEKLTPWQKLYQANPEVALAQLQNNTLTTTPA